MTKDEIITMLERQLMLAYQEIEELEDKLARRWKKKDTRLENRGGKSFMDRQREAPRERSILTREPRKRSVIIR